MRGPPGTRDPRKVSSLHSFAARVYHKSADDRVFFLASGLTFSVLLASIPFLLLVISLPTLLLGSEMGRFQDEALRWLWEIVPVTVPEVRADLGSKLQSVVDSAGSIGLVGAILFAWFSTRLFGALRTALSEVFDLDDTRGVIRGKLVDMQLVLISTLLLSLNIGVTAFFGISSSAWLGRIGFRTELIPGGLAFATVFAAVYVMFLLIYKFVPAKPLPWRTAAVAALFASTTFELLKSAFGWYVSNFADYSTIFFAFTTVVVLVISVYYSSVLFLMGGEVAQVYDLYRRMRGQREIFE